MLAYTYDTEGYLTGTVNAIPDPLGTAIKGSPQFLAPKGATLLEPPATVDGEKARFVGGAWTVAVSWIGLLIWKGESVVRCNYNGALKLEHSATPLQEIQPCMDFLANAPEGGGKTNQQLLDMYRRRPKYLPRKFLERFNPETELKPIYNFAYSDAVGAVDVRIWLDSISGSDYIDPLHPRVITGMTWMAFSNFISESRLYEILAVGG